MSEIYVYVEHIQGKVTDITYMNLAQAKAIAADTGDKVVAVLLGNKAAELAGDLSADEVLYIEHPGLSEYTYDANLKVLANLISEREPRLVLFGDTTIGSDIAGALSARLKLPLLSFCNEIHMESGALKYSLQEKSPMGPFF
jgi:electron transfer flavoprotein alpha subunit